MPTPNLEQLAIRRVIVHEIPKTLAGGAKVEAELSEVESALNDDLKDYFKRRIREVILKRGVCVRFDPKTTSPVPHLVTETLTGKGHDFVKASQVMARHLTAVQPPISPQGLLTVIEAELGKTPAMAILKLEKETGIQARPIRETGHRTFNLARIKDLMLGDQIQVFKAGLFRQTGTTPASIHGDVSDTQIGYQLTSHVAAFFLQRFLGFNYCREPARTTQEYFETAEAFANEVVDPVLRTRYEMAIVTELASSEPLVDPVSFANKHLVSKDRESFLAAIRAAGLGEEKFAKDIERIKNRIQRVSVLFEGGLSVIGTADAMKETATIEKSGEDRMRLTITDRVRKAKGHR